MLKTEQFRLVMYPERKKMLEFLAKREGRSKANLIDRLILEKYESLKGEKKSQRGDQSQIPQVQT